MENENLTPAPEQPVQSPEQPAQVPVQPQYPPQYRQPAPPQYPPQYRPPQPPQYPPQYRPPQRPQYPPQYRQPERPQYPPQDRRPAPQDPQPANNDQPAQPKKKTAAWKIIVPIAAVLMLAVLVCVYFLFLRSTPVEKLTLSETSLYLKPGDGYELYFSVVPADADESNYTWTTSDPAVATVENGGVTAVGDGKCTVTLQAGDARAVCQVTVETPAPDGGDIVGTWRFNGAVIDGEAYNADEADVKLTVYADHTGVLLIDSDKVRLRWEFSYREDGVDHYTVHADDGTVCEFFYYGDLTLYGDEHNSMNFQR